MSVIGMQGMKRDRQAVSAEMLSCVRLLATSLGFRSVPRIFVTKRIQEAVVAGFFRPMILLPAAWLMELSPDVLEAVIAHELSHLRRTRVIVKSTKAPFQVFQQLTSAIKVRCGHAPPQVELIASRSPVDGGKLVDNEGIVRRTKVACLADVQSAQIDVVRNV